MASSSPSPSSSAAPPPLSSPSNNAPDASSSAAPRPDTSSSSSAAPRPDTSSSSSAAPRPDALSSSSAAPRPDASSSSSETSASGMQVAPNGLVVRPTTPEGAKHPANVTLADNEYDAMQAGWPGMRKRALEERQAELEKRPRVEKRYILMGMEPLHAPYHNELSAAEQAIDYRLYRDPGNVAGEKDALFRIVTHQPHKRVVGASDEGCDVVFPSLAVYLRKMDLPADLFSSVPEPEDPALRYRVIALSQDARYLAMSPNATYAPYTPSPDDEFYRLRMRIDGNFGAEDLTLVPTFFMRGRAPHIACIPRCPPAPGHPWHLMFLGVEVWFEKIDTRYSPDDDKVVLTPAAFTELKKLIWPLRKLTAQYLLECKQKKVEAIPWARGLEITLHHLLMRMSYLPVNLRRAVLMARQCQRLWRELFGMLNFVNLVQGVLTGLVDPPTLATPHWFIGTMTEDLDQMQLLFRAGVPVWYVQDVESVCALARVPGRQGVPHAKVTAQMRSQAEMVCIDRHPDNLPYIWQGTPRDWQRLHYMHRYSTTSVALGKPADGDKHDPLFFDGDRNNRHARFGASTEQDLKDMPTYITEVASVGPPANASRELITLPPVDFALPSVLDEEIDEPSEMLPAVFYGSGKGKDRAPPSQPSSSAPWSSRGSPPVASSSSAPSAASRSIAPSTTAPAPAATWVGYAPRPPAGPPPSRPRADLPSVPESWADQIRRVKPNWATEAVKTDDHRCFPTPSVMVGPATTEKCAFFLQAWTLLLPTLLENARRNLRDADAFAMHGQGMAEHSWGSTAPHVQRRNPVGLSSGDWRQLLFARVTGRSQNSFVGYQMTEVRKVLGDDFKWTTFVDDLFKPYTLRGEVLQPGILPSPRTLRIELMYMQELGFRQDFTEVDRRVRVVFVNAFEETERLRRVFDKRTWNGIDILCLRDLGTGRGLAAWDWVERSRYVQALAQVMKTWHPSLPKRLHAAADAHRIAAEDYLWFEGQVIAFYVRVLWHALHRTAIAPPRYPDGP